MKSLGDLGVHIVLVPSAAKFRETWNKSLTPPRLESTDSARRGGEVSATIMFHGCVARASGKCNASVRFSLVAPDGRTMPAGEGPLWLEAPQRGRGLLADASLTVGFDMNDKAGRYNVVATVIEHESGKQLRVSALFTLL